VKTQLFKGAITDWVMESAIANTLALPAASSLIASFPNFKLIGLIEGLTPLVSQYEISEDSNPINLCPPFILPIKVRSVGNKGLIYQA